MSKQPLPAPTASAVGPCPTVIEIIGCPGTGSLPRTMVTGRFGPIPVPTPCRFCPIPFRSGRFGLGRFGPISGVGPFGPILVGPFGPLYII